MSPLQFFPYNRRYENILLKFMEDFYTIDNHDFDKKRVLGAVRSLKQNPTLIEIWMMEMGQEIIGYLCIVFGFSLEFGGKDCFLDELYFVEDYRSRGLGKLAMNFIEKRAANSGALAVHLEVRGNNKPARKLYMDQGYEPHKSVFMSKRLI